MINHTIMTSLLPIFWWASIIVLNLKLNVFVYISRFLLEAWVIYSMGIFISPEKPGLIPTFCKRINRTSTAIGS